jgi:periplasmic nitrate reductase NapD
MTKSRRAFMRGKLTAGQPNRSATDPHTVEIVSLIVNAWPKHLDNVATAILELGGTEIHGRDPKGKLIVVLEAATHGGIGTKTNVISGLPNVLSAVMVFQATDSDSPMIEVGT